jgi:uridine kinase
VTRERLLSVLAHRICAVGRTHAVRVAIDGVDVAGKTTLADELVAPIERLGRPAIRASIDGFHNTVEIRYGRGRSSAEGYFRDSFNRAGLVQVLLAPLGPGGTRRYRCPMFDVRADAPVDATEQEASADAILLFDGVFLQVPELRPHWDYSIFVRASFETTVARAEQRDRTLFATPWPFVAGTSVPGQRLYLSEVDPERYADVTVINDDVASPSMNERQQVPEKATNLNFRTSNCGFVFFSEPLARRTGRRRARRATPVPA